MVCSSLKSSQLGKLVLSSGVLDLSWSKISNLHGSTYEDKHSALRTEIYHEAEYIFVVFSVSAICKNSSPSTRISEETNMFSFLYSEKISSFSLHTPALEIFSCSKYDELLMLKSELLESPKRVIITGTALGGSVASLFTLWLLEKIYPTKKRPLCITFGSPLIGDASLQQILKHSVMNSCFLHVAEAAETSITEDVFKPFGTFLICFDSECICIDDPEAVLELLNGVKKDLVGWTDYGKVIKRLHYSSMAESSLMNDGVIDRIEERARKKKPRFDLLNKQNDSCIGMIYLECYVKQSKKLKICSYDYLKTQTIPHPQFRNELSDFYKSLVEEVENMPTEKSILMTRSLLHTAVNNYIRLVEPFDIAEYYLNVRKEYRTTGRSRHYVMLEKWRNESIRKMRIHRQGKDLSDLLTFDSCFWAEVEEAMLINNVLLETNEEMKHEELIGKLVRFEEYVWEMILRNEVSPEIFLKESTFMRWWKEYKEIKGRYGFDSTPSHFIEFMNSEMYKSYGSKNLLNCSYCMLF